MSAEEISGKKDDGYLAAGILLSAVLVVISVGLYMWRRNKLALNVDGSDNRFVTFLTPSSDWDEYTVN